MDLPEQRIKPDWWFFENNMEDINITKLKECITWLKKKFGFTFPLKDATKKQICHKITEVVNENKDFLRKLFPKFTKENEY